MSKLPPYKEQVLEVIEQHEKGLITETEMWLDISSKTGLALNYLEYTDEELVA